MRCNICDKEGAVAYRPPDYLCETCINVILRASGKVFGMAELYDILLPNEDDELKGHLK